MPLDSNKKKFIIGAYPRNDQYCNKFYNRLEKYDIYAVQGEIGFRWLFLKRYRIDALHFHWPSFYYGRNNIKMFIRFFLFIIFSKLLHIKIIWTAHNLYPHNIRKIGIMDYFARILIILFSDLIFVHGPTSRDAIIKEFKIAKLKCFCIIDHGNYLEEIPNDISISDARRKLRIVDSAFVYLALGKATPYKGLEDLISAFGIVSNENDRLIIAGRFPNYKYLEKIKKKIRKLGHLQNRVLLIDKRIEDNELQIFFNAANVMVLPYKHKSVLTSGIALIALSFGLPIIAPNVGYLNDIIKEEYLGLLYPPNSSIDTISQCLKQAKKIHFARDRILKYAARYEWESICNKANNSIATHFIERN